MSVLTRTAALALAVGAFALIPVGSACADTNKNLQESQISGGLAYLLSPAEPGNNLQVGRQNMTKTHTVNNSLIDYIELAATKVTAP
ncbi:hypothetical protein [Streptomyces sp. I05A-00742]|uniref:hypothetical protein n=1 Tax=Streptomyces sp. I05A-00742 TaxID=2732853 RepID=UPI00148A0A2C|nr:hypothetical protein [Streptomyces sp. I05A-00742]